MNPLDLTAKSELTSANWFAGKSDLDVAFWLAEDARRLDGTPGNNNHVAMVRTAAQRLYDYATKETK